MCPSLCSLFLQIPSQLRKCFLFILKESFDDWNTLAWPELIAALQNAGVIG